MLKICPKKTTMLNNIITIPWVLHVMTGSARGTTPPEMGTTVAMTVLFLFALTRNEVLVRTAAKR